MYELAKKIELLGLTEKESVVYAYLLSVSGAYPSDIADKTKINRSTVYKTLISLSIKGLVAEIKKGKKIFYQSETPKKIKSLVRYKLEEAELIADRADKILPVLEGFFNKSSGRPGVTYYEGRDAVINAYLKHIHVEKGYEMLAFVSVVDLKKFLPQKTLRFYIKEKERLNITAKGITSSDQESDSFNKELFSAVKKSIWPEFRHLNKELFSFPAEITLFDQNKISIVKFDELNPIAVIIEDQIFFDMLKTIFFIVWDYAQ